MTFAKYRNIAIILSFPIVACQDIGNVTGTNLDSKPIPFKGTEMEGIKKFTCLPKLLSSCSFDGCFSNETTDYAIIEIDLDQPTYRRCSSDVCQSMTPLVGWHGNTLNLAVLNEGYFFRVTSSGAFMDSAPLGVGTVMIFGQCLPY